MWAGNDCHDKRPTFIFLIDGNISDKPQQLHWIRATIGVTHGNTNLSQYNCIQDGATLKSEGTAFASSPKPKISLASLVAIANPDARRPTSIRYQYFFSSSPILRSACALSFSLSLSFFFFSFTSLHFFFPFSFYKTLRGLRFFIHAFWSQGIEEKYQWKESWT